MEMNSIGSPLESLYRPSAIIDLRLIFSDKTLFSGRNNGSLVGFRPAKVLIIMASEGSVISSSFLLGMLSDWLFCVCVDNNISGKRALTEYVLDRVEFIGFNNHVSSELTRAVERWYSEHLGRLRESGMTIVSSREKGVDWVSTSSGVIKAPRKK
ncbi:iron ABC transporter substrate-binding protein [Pectobacterium phage DU_PP_V]|uniref:Iron ABC transporter substrate-binding protein n=1 Tax=Pectobacterium phage DU_PP_V TaxID=2041492 RepID=A0A2D2W734_9CAUD|nr:iron ABC transporter substrate-binding protein [Pectobacterium phage DU_PP_V]ATS94111.1 iron ABC transporter substrate-binding protein [Pectobacterium phage DU_PP_V]